MKQHNRITGLVERVTFHNPDNGFCVIKVKVYGKRDLVTIIGNSPTILTGEHVECFGDWINDKEHGLQFKTEVLKLTAPTSLEGIEKYLASGLIKGVGPIYAKKLVNAFGREVFSVIEQSPEQLRTVNGIGKARIEVICTSWQIQKSVRQIILFLHGHGISTARATRIYKEYGAEAISIVEANPYKLANDIKGIGFKSVDKIAQSLGIAEDSMIRLRAGVNYALSSAMDNGNCGLSINKLVSLSKHLLEVDQQLIVDAIDLEVADQHIVKEVVNNENCLFIKSLHVLEAKIAHTLVNMSRGKMSWPPIDSAKAIKEVMTETKLELSNSQQEAIKWVLCGRVSIVTGGPGVGKTTLINSIIKILSKKHVDILLTAPTGRAAKRLSEATGMAATTIHRLLGRNPDHEYHKTNPIKCRLLIVDEVSMLDIALMHAILKALPENAALLLVGDKDQLPSVGAGQVLSDIINSESVTVAALTEVFRQSQQSNIIVNAHRINQGLLPFTQQKTSSNADKANSSSSQLNDFFFIECDDPDNIAQSIVDLVKNRLPRKFNINPLTDIQVLSPMTKGILGTRALNLALQQALLPHTSIHDEVEAFGSLFKKQDKVMQTVNNYDKDVFNGDLGIISNINKDNQTVTIKFDNREVVYEYGELDEIIHAYAITIHKSQGSEYHTVIIPLSQQHYVMLQRNLIYTAVTRAKKLVIMIGQKQALKTAVGKNALDARYSTLKQRLVEITGWH
ncbi:MAG: ATP-dependent RecD-like DNA helicase [Sphingobacteriaceae bacterium]|nr:MAG: ATP-dependent RecD-like DNA helicase [Sphingobacteriaceae bacterium]